MLETMLTISMIPFMFFYLISFWLRRMRALTVIHVQYSIHQYSAYIEYEDDCQDMHKQTMKCLGKRQRLI